MLERSKAERMQSGKRFKLQQHKDSSHEDNQEWGPVTLDHQEWEPVSLDNQECDPVTLDNQEWAPLTLDN